MGRTLDSRLLLAAATVAATAVAMPAQQQFVALTRHQLPSLTSNANRIAVGDFDLDGDADLLLAASIGGLHAGAQDRLLRNDGNGRFLDATAGRLPTILEASHDVAVGDLDGDGDLDAIFATNIRVKVLLNSGAGVFTPLPQPAISFLAARSIALGDVDGDGDLDAVAAPGDMLLRNDGNGHFTPEPASMPNPLDNSTDVVLGDFDGDGDLDVAMSNNEYTGYYQPNVPGRTSLYLNDGTGTFTDVSATFMPNHNGHNMSVVAGDLDADGDLDLAVGGWDHWGPYIGPDRLRLLQNDGTGHFASLLTASWAHALELTTGDIDGDGDLDLTVANLGFVYPTSSYDLLLLNNGVGGLTDATLQRAPTEDHATTASVLVDVDGDGDQDWVTGTLGIGAWLHLNVQRQLHAPTAPQLGQPYTLDAYMRYTTPSTADLAAIWLSAGTTNVPTPFGALRIDLATAAPVDVLTIPHPAGVATATVNVPNAPSLVGVEVFCQAVMIGYPHELRLSNLVADVIGL